ncbi:MAG: cohesin domain-containing protein [Bacteroidota bacterium]
MKRIILLLCAMFLYASMSYAQATTMTIGSVKASIGESVKVPVNVTYFNNVGSITLKVKYDPATVQYKSVTSAVSGVSYVANAVEGVIYINWAGISPINLMSGKLLDLDLTYLGGKGNLEFIGSECEIATVSGSIIPNIQYVNGSVENIPGTETNVKLGSVTANQNEDVSVPMTVKNFKNIGSITLKVKYDPSVLTYKGVSNAPTGVDLVANASEGIVYINWAGITPINIDDAKLVDINFNYKGGAANLEFLNAQCELSTVSGTVLTNVAYENGSVGPKAGSEIKVGLGSVTGEQGQDIAVPVTVEKFQNIGSITLKVKYDPAVLTYKSVSNAPTGVDFVANASEGIVYINWAGITPVNIDAAKLVDINFNYKGGSSNLEFVTAQCELASITGSILANVVYTNGTVSPKTGTETLVSLASVKAVTGQDVSVPMTVENFKNIGSITLKVKYDPAVLTYKGVSNAPTGVDFVANASEGIVYINWAGITPVNIDSAKLVDINFNYKGGSSNLEFLTAQCELASVTGSVLANVVYANATVGPVPQDLVKVSIAAVKAPVNSTVAVPVNVQNFKNIGSITLKIQYDANSLEYKDVTNGPTGVVANASEGIIYINWAGINAISLDSAKLADINFTYKGGNGNLSFIASQCELAQVTGNVLTNVTYTNGGVIPSEGSYPKLTIPSLYNTIGDQIKVPLIAENFVKVGSITLEIQYNTASLTYKGISDQFAGTEQLVANAKDGVVYINWAGINALNIAKDSLLSINFEYNGGVSGIAFNKSKSEITSDNGQIYYVEYVDGSVKMNVYPVFTAELKDTTIAENQALKFTYTAKDDNGQALTFKIAKAPKGATINATTGEFAWKPDYTQAGKHDVVIVVTDGVLNDTSRVSIVTVTNVNRGPYFTKVLADTSFPANRTYSINYDGKDDDGDKLTYALVKAPKGAAINTGSGVVTWVTDLSMIGQKYLLIVSVTDGKATAYDTAKVEITSAVSVNDPDEIVPTVYSLSQNYPNPFNPSTKIEYALPQESRVSLKVYNLLGQEVITLVNQVQSAGVHSVNFDASRLTSGLYIYRLEAGKYISVKKMTLVK